MTKNSPRDWDAAHRTAPAVPRIELPALASIRDSEERFYVTMYLRGAQDSDQDEARKRCATWGIDYKTVKGEADRT
jgi:hypothetical protein